MAEEKRIAEEKVLGVWTNEEFKDTVVSALAMGVMIGTMSFVLSWLKKKQEKKRQEKT